MRAGKRAHNLASKGPAKGRKKKTLKKETTKKGTEIALSRVPRIPRGWPEDGFGRWYALYPRKKDRGAAEKAFAKIRARGSIGFDELLAATASFAQSTNEKDPQFIKHPATWLNADSYLNEPDKPKGAAHEATIAEPSLGPQSFSDEDWKDRLHNNWAKGEWSSIGDPVPANLAVEFLCTSSMEAQMNNATEDAA